MADPKLIETDFWADVNSYTVTIQSGSELSDAGEVIKINTETDLVLHPGVIIHIGTTPYAVEDHISDSKQKPALLLAGREVELLHDTHIKLKAGLPLRQIPDDIFFVLSVDKLAVIKAPFTKLSDQPLAVLKYVHKYNMCPVPYEHQYDQCPMQQSNSVVTPKLQNYFITFLYDTVMFRSIETNNIIQTISRKDKILDCICSPDQRMIAIRHSKFIQVLDIVDFKTVRTIAYRSELFNDFGINDTDVFISNVIEVEIWNIRTGIYRKVDCIGFIQHVMIRNDLIYCLIRSTMTDINCFRTFDARGKKIDDMILHLDVKSFYVWSNQTIILGCADGSIRTMKGNIMSKPQTVCSGAINRISIVDNKILCYCYASSSVVILDSAWRKYQEFQI